MAFERLNIGLVFIGVVVAVATLGYTIYMNQEVTVVKIFRQDGLLTFDYRTDPNTPGQYVICAKTKLSGDNCPLVLTLKPEDNPYEALREVAGALLPGSLPSYQCDNPENCPPPEPVTISLDEQL